MSFMHKIINKKLLTIELLYLLFGCFVLLIVCFLSKTQMISPDTYGINAIITISIIVITAFVIIVYNKLQNVTVHITDLVVSFIFPFIFVAIYQIPAFDFVGQNGVNNSVALVCFFTLYAFFVYDLSFAAYERYKNIYIKIGSNNIAKSYIHKIIRYIGTYIVVLGVIFSLINIFVPKFVVSDLFQF